MILILSAHVPFIQHLDLGIIPGFRIRIDLMQIRIRMQHFFYLRIWIPDPDPGSGSRIDDLKLKKIYSWKFNFYFLDQKLQFTYP